MTHPTKLFIKHGPNEFDTDQARSYEERRFDRDPRMRAIHRRETAFAERVLNHIGQDVHVLDIPCGSGRFIDVFEKATKVTMADLSPHMHEVAQEKIQSLAHVDIMQADICNIPLPDASVDATFTLSLIHI